MNMQFSNTNKKARKRDKCYLLGSKDPLAIHQSRTKKKGKKKHIQVTLTGPSKVKYIERGKQDMPTTLLDITLQK